MNQKHCRRLGFGHSAAYLVFLQTFSHVGALNSNSALKLRNGLHELLFIIIKKNAVFLPLRVYHLNKLFQFPHASGPDTYCVTEQI